MQKDILNTFRIATLIWSASFLLLIALFFVSVQQGSFTFSLFELFKEWQLKGNDFFLSDNWMVFSTFRLPRTLLCVIAGGIFALSGYLIQVVFNNPLGDPYLLGTASAASLGANISLGGLIPLYIGSLYIPPIAALVFACGGSFLLLALAYRRNQSRESLILSGVAIAALAGAISNVIIFLNDDNANTLKTILFWMLGGLENAQLWPVLYLGFALFMALALIKILYPKFILLVMGDTLAANLGLEVKRQRIIILIIASSLTGLAIMQTGVIGFIGLAVPHLARNVYLVTKIKSIWLSVLWGGIMLLGCDVLSKMIYPPTGLPAGVITAFAGLPFFVYLLRKSSKRLL